MSIENLWPFGRKKKKMPSMPKQRSVDNDAYNVLTKVKTPVEQLAIGMYVAELDKPWIETSFLFQGFEIRNEDELRKLKEVCRYVYIDVTKRKKATPLKPVRQSFENQTLEIPIYTNTNTRPPKKLGQFENEIPRAEKIYEQAERVVSHFMRNVENGGGIDSEIAKKAVSACVNSILHSPDAMLWLSQLRDKDTLLAQHSLNVSILSIVLGRHINLSSADLNKVGLCGMMHDVGKLLIPPEILHKTTPLDDEEIRIMKTHTRLGYNLLKFNSNISSSVAIVALTHHEQLDGNGYPRRLTESNISLFSKIISIANAYDDMVTDKPYQKAKTHLEATQILTNLSGSHYDPTLVVKFIESIGVYPPGSLVELTNGSVGLVIEVHEKAKLRPKVILILDEEKKPIPEQVIDLALMGTDSYGNVYTIKNIIKAKDWNLDVSQYYQKGLLQKKFKKA